MLFECVNCFASGGGFGGDMFGLGGKPSAEKANTNVFGTSTFGSGAGSQSKGKISRHGKVLVLCTVVMHSIHILY